MTRPGQAYREVALYGVCCGILVAALRLAECRLLVLGRSVEIHGAIVAAVFAGPGIGLGGTITKKKPEVIVREVPGDV